jgi:hypothetical protein
MVFHFLFPFFKSTHYLSHRTEYFLIGIRKEGENHFWSKGSRFEEIQPRVISEEPHSVGEKASFCYLPTVPLRSVG